jgi:hypothetical protein
LRDPVQEFIDRQLSGLAGKWGEPPKQKHCHPQGTFESELLAALDDKEALGGYDDPTFEQN